MSAEEKKNYFKKMIILGVPILFQNLIEIGLNLLDTVMIGLLGEAELAAVGAANQVYFVFAISLFGLCSGSSVYISQYYGSDNEKGIKHVIGMNWMITVIAGLLVTAIAFIKAPSLIGFFSKDQQVIGFGTEYLRIVCFSYVFSAISMSISYNSRAVQNVNIPAAINGVALVLNGILNYLFIFGKLGIPAMGVRGAALGTLIARVFEFISFIIFIRSQKQHPFRASFAELFGFSSKLFRSVMKLAVPVILTEGCWAVTTSLVFSAYGKLGMEALAVTQIANVICEILICAYFGVGNATAVMIGEALGKGKEDLAYSYGKNAILASFVLNLAVTVIMYVISVPVASIYGFGIETTALLIKTMKVMGLLVTPKMFAYIFIVGILRGGGDTVFCMYVEVGCNLLLMLPLSYIGVLYLGMSLPEVMAFGEISDVARIILCIPRFINKKWINTVCNDKVEETISK